MKQYDYLIVGAGLYGAVFAHEAKKAGKRCLVIDKRDHIAGNVYTRKVNGINVHEYGAHIFHTSDKRVWDYVNQFAEFNNYINAPVANYHGELYNLPFNMNTFSKMWGVTTPAEARAKIDEQVAAELRAHGGRVEVYEQNEPMRVKIAKAQGQRVPYMLVIGDKEVENGEVAVRERHEGDLGSMKLEYFTKIIEEAQV